jgi:hypothetical protein
MITPLITFHYDYDAPAERRWCAASADDTPFRHIFSLASRSWFSWHTPLFSCRYAFFGHCIRHCRPPHFRFHQRVINSFLNAFIDIDAGHAELMPFHYATDYLSSSSLSTLTRTPLRASLLLLCPAAADIATYFEPFSSPFRHFAAT